MTGPEARIEKEIMLAVSRAGHLIWRNNVQAAWVGRVRLKEHDTVMLDRAHQILAGLCKGSADLIGLTSTGRFLALEVKAPRGRPSPEQLNFIACVRGSGGIAGIVRSPEEALALIEESL